MNTLMVVRGKILQELFAWAGKYFGIFLGGLIHFSAVFGVFYFCE